jgi:hypothetical protein
MATDSLLPQTITAESSPVVATSASAVQPPAPQQTPSTPAPSSSDAPAVSAKSNAVLPQNISQAASETTLPNSNPTKKPRRRINRSRTNTVAQSGVSQDVGTAKTGAVEGSGPGVTDKESSGVDGKVVAKQTEDGKENSTNLAVISKDPGSSAGKAKVIKAKGKAVQAAKVKKAVEQAKKDKGSLKKSGKQGGLTGKQVGGKAKPAVGKGRTNGKGELKGKGGVTAGVVPTKKAINGSQAQRQPKLNGGATASGNKGAARKDTKTPTVKNNIASSPASPIASPVGVTSTDATPEVASQTPLHTSSTSDETKTTSTDKKGAPTSMRRLRPGKAARQQAKLEAATKSEESTVQGLLVEPVQTIVEVPAAATASSPVPESSAPVAKSSEPVEQPVPVVSLDTDAAARGTKRRRANTKTGPVKTETSAAGVVPSAGKNQSTKPSSSQSRPAKKAKSDVAKSASTGVAKSPTTRQTKGKATQTPKTTNSTATSARSVQDLERELERTVLQLKMAELEVQKLKLEAELAQSRDV